MSIAVAILGLAVLILVHEAGHFFVARAVGMSPRKFYVGFPPAIARVRRNGIEYGLGAIPLGGYVKIPGMHRPAPVDVDRFFVRARAEDHTTQAATAQLKRELEDGDFAAAGDAVDRLETGLRTTDLSPAAARDATRGIAELRDALGADAYWRQRTWKKVAVIAAGPVTNLAFAVALLAAVFMIGVPTAATRVVEEVEAGSPAERAGLREGDEIVAVGGRRVTPEAIPARVQESRGRPIVVTVRRDGRVVDLEPTRARRDDERDGRLRLGFKLAPVYESYGLAAAIARASRATWEVTKAIGAALGRLATGENREEVASPVGIVQGSSEAYEVGFRYYLQVLALISLSLALLNLLPLLPLDGGHITFSVVEALRGRALGREVYERVSFVGIALVLFLFAIGLSNDIGRLSR